MTRAFVNVSVTRSFKWTRDKEEFFCLFLCIDSKQSHMSDKKRMCSWNLPPTHGGHTSHRIGPVCHKMGQNWDYLTSLFYSFCRKAGTLGDHSDLPEWNPCYSHVLGAWCRTRWGWEKALQFHYVIHWLCMFNPSNRRWYQASKQAKR